MKVVVSMDSFKGSLSSQSAADGVAQGILNVFDTAQIFKVPIADGGEGTVDALCNNKIKLKVHGPLNEIIYSEYGITDQGVAVIEMAAAAGLLLVPEEKRNPMYTTTFGVGELILDAIKRGIRDFIIGIGGSATNDGGTGMLSALGFRFLDKQGEEIKLGAVGLKELHSIDVSGAAKQLAECNFAVACDVNNPLCGENGCSYVFAPQKGASIEEIFLMDSWLEKYAEITNTLFKNVSPDSKGAGAAGGLGFAFLAFLNAKLSPGIDVITKKIGLEEKIIGSDFVITGEGRLDTQSVRGKTPVGVASLAKKHNIPVIAICGSIGKDATVCNEYIDAYFPILKEFTSPAQALNSSYAYSNLVETTEQVFRLIKSLKNM